MVAVKPFEEVAHGDSETGGIGAIGAAGVLGATS